MTTISERLRRDHEVPIENGRSFDVAMVVPLRELRHEAADTIDALVEALERARKFTGEYSGRKIDRINAEIDAALARVKQGG